MLQPGYGYLSPGTVSRHDVGDPSEPGMALKRVPGGRYPRRGGRIALISKNWMGLLIGSATPWGIQQQQGVPP